MSFTLVILAAGLGSRYGGLKQLQPVGPNNEILMDYSIFDAIKAGCNKVICIIRKDIEQDFHKLIGQKWEKKVAIHYVFQELDSFVPKQEIWQNRQKPWGTGHAILCCHKIINEPFVVINADDFYGSNSYQLIAKFLHGKLKNSNQFGMVAFKLGNTLSKNGTVSRGICTVQDKYLKNLKEHSEIHEQNKKIVSQGKTLDKNHPVSMNFWGVTPFIFSHLEEQFELFLEKNKQEFYLPLVVDFLIQKSLASVEVLYSHDKWIGITNPEDLIIAEKEIQNLTTKSCYPCNLVKNY